MLNYKKQYKKPNVKKIKNIAILNSKKYLIENWDMLLAEL